MLELWAERTVPSSRTAIALPYPPSTLGSWETEAHQTEQGTGLEPLDGCVKGQSTAHRVCQCVLGDLRASSWRPPFRRCEQENASVRLELDTEMFTLRQFSVPTVIKLGP